jgi:cysteine/glycine-rich protein
MECRKSVDSTTMADKDLVMYCKTCHTKKFGTKGYGYGGAVTL